MNKLAVGQKLWLVQNMGNNPKDTGREVVVTKVGRKWAEIKGWYPRSRIDMETMRTEYSGTGAPDLCYLSKETYEAKRELDIAANDFRFAIRDGRVIYSATIEQIRQCAAILGIELSGGK